MQVFSSIPLVDLRADLVATLDLSDRDLGIAEGLVLAELLRSSGALRHLNLWSNNIRDEGAIAISESLHTY